MEETIIEPLVTRGGAARFFFGFAMTVFSFLSAGFGTIAYKICSTAMLTALFGVTGAPIAAGATAACVTTASIAMLSGGIAAGLGVYGAGIGWSTAPVPAVPIGTSKIRNVHGSLHYNDTAFGLHHMWDGERYDQFSSHYGPMLQKHNTTLLSITWLEASGARNHTGTAFEGVNMTTHGRLVSLYDNGMIRTSLGHVDDIHTMFQAVNDMVGRPSPWSESHGVPWGPWGEWF